ncbi:hypothetical protein K474DRAFT_1607515 [Panus rudis PR-1116 ss-1]|nr:hypothetical protein K474DRAFT_1607515 [Panus rudis PR-1116 ss-1]
MHFPFTPNHVQLIAACYPPHAALLTSGPEYRPNSQELSRLTYYASNRTGKINKLSGELERRVRMDCRKAQAGNLRARASLLISLAIFRALATECRRDIALLTASLLASINVTLQALRTDLEVATRAASVFTAWTTYTDGHLVGVDRYVTEEYMSCLQMFSHMGRIDQESMDHEIRNRTRLLGQTVLQAVVTSEALYYSTVQFGTQISCIVPAILIPLFDVSVSTLDQESETMKTKSSSGYLEGFRDRPTIERRAASIHLHIDGDKGPSSADVANIALRAISILLQHSNASQAGTVIGAAFECFDDINGWEKIDHCQWIAVKGAEWTQYQYRYAIPTRMVEYLVEGQDVVQATPRHLALAAMIKAVFTSPTPLINLSTSDIISSLINLIFKRVVVQEDDPLLPSLVECIASLGTHVYYADQIQDLASELIGRLILVEINGLSNGKPASDKSRAQAVRCLLAGLVGLMHAADKHEAAKDDAAEESKPRKGATSPTISSADPFSADTRIKPSRRTRIAPDIWQETLTLLCDSDYSVRADYAEALISYLKHEIPKLGDHVDEDGVKRVRPVADGPSRQATTFTSVMYGDSITRFLHALHAHLYVLATSSNLGLASESASTSPHARSQSRDRHSRSHSRSQDSSSGSRENTRRSTTVPPRTRKSSVMTRLMQSTTRTLSSGTTRSATLSDYANILAILTAVQENLPVRGLLTGVPMLVALDAISSNVEEADPVVSMRSKALKETIVKVWLTIGRVWSSPEITEAAEKVCSAIPSPGLLQPPDFDSRPSGTIDPPRQPIPIRTDPEEDAPVTTLNVEELIAALAARQSVQEATGLDETGLLKRFTTQWTPESALQESLDTQTSYDALRHDTISPLIKVAPALMQIENMSLHSLARSTRGGGVGVTDLREALEGRSSMSNPNLSHRAPSLSTLEHTSTVAHGEPSLSRLTPVRSRPQQRNKIAGPGEVKDVLNRLGIGKSSSGNILKPSFPGLQKTEQRYVSTTDEPC